MDIKNTKVNNPYGIIRMTQRVICPIIIYIKNI
jgi:hypothetical protein